MNHKIKWDSSGFPHSLLFDDKYFCEESGLLESEHVFCRGNHLKERWSNLSTKRSGVFTIAETGFGTGLNFLCAWKLWRECAPSNWSLHYFSIDQYPLSREDLEKSLLYWSDLDEYSRLLIEQYPALECQFDESNVNLTLIFDDVNSALGKISRSVDAWFLDGFAPSKNPQMWSEEVFSQMAEASHLDTTVSTFTVAGMVRRGLGREGFDVKKIKGFGKKLEMLSAQYAGSKEHDD